MLTKSSALRDGLRNVADGRELELQAGPAAPKEASLPPGPSPA
jgi:hypothetical protein